MSQPLVSVIIPLYNRKHLISRCLKSACEQSYQNLEIIVVDDGSTDHPEDVLKEWEKDTRIKVFRKPNGGVSSARNMGIESATGEFVQFLDSDDELLPQAIETLVREMVREQVDAVSYQHLQEGKKYTGAYRTEVVRETDGISAINRWRTPCSPANKFYRRQIIGNDVRFPEDISWGEDYVFNTHYFRKCRSVCRIFYPYYLVHRESGSLTIRYDERSFDGAVAQYEAVADYMDNERHPDISAIVSSYLWLCWIACVRKLILLAPLTYGEKVSTLKNWMKSDFAQAMSPQFRPHTLDCFALSKGWVHYTYFAVLFCSAKSHLRQTIKKWLKAS